MFFPGFFSVHTLKYLKWQIERLSLLLLFPVREVVPLMKLSANLASLILRSSGIECLCAKQMKP